MTRAILNLVNLFILLFSPTPKLGLFFFRFLVPRAVVNHEGRLRLLLLPFLKDANRLEVFNLNALKFAEAGFSIIRCD